MELKRVEMVGFKSFSERIVVEFDKGITAIVGPNGSGKSNIADAVRWVLGEQSAKSLRGSRMEDVIFAGTARRKPLGYAEVTLVLDNSDKEIKVDYDEIAIRRRLFRSGESEYAINDGKCRLKDIQELLMDTGIGKDGYSMIGQGQIDRLLSSRPQDRRMIFEEASGITKYKTRREEAEKKLQDQEQQLLRVEDILTELRSREESLKQQAETAEVYLKLREELKLYEVSAFIGEYDQLQNQYQKVSDQMNDLMAQIDASKEEQQSAREISEKLSKEAVLARTELSAMNDSLRELMLQKEKAEGDKRVAEGLRDRHLDEIKSLNERVEELKEKIHERTVTLDKEEKKIEECQAQIDHENDLLLDFQAELRAAASEASAKQKDLDELGRITLRYNQELMELKMSLERKTMQVQQDEQTAQNYEADRKALQDELTDAEEKQKELEQTRSDVEGKLQQCLDEQEKLEVALKEADEKVKEMKGRQESDLLLMKDLTRKLQWLRSLENEYEGFSGPVKAVMKQKSVYGDRIRGTLSDVIRMAPEYAIALENALGPAVQNIVVQDTQAAKALVEYLRKNDLGRATFLPMDAVTARNQGKEASDVLSMVGVVGYANELVETRPEYQKIMSRLLGNVIVADTFDHGSAVSRKYGQYLRVVTLKGDMFNIGGSITGGSSKQKGANLLTRKAESDAVQQELKELRDQADLVQKELSKHMNLFTQVNMELIGKKKEAAEINREKMHLEQELRQLAYVKEQAGSRLEALEQAFLDRTGSPEKLEEEKKQYESTILTKETALKEHQDKVTALQATVDQLNAELTAGREEEGRKTIAIAGIRQQRRFLEQSGEWERKEIEALSLEAEQAMDERNVLAEQQKTGEDQIREIDRQICVMNEEISEKQADIDKQQNMVDAMDSQREESLKASEEKIRAGAQLEKEQIRLESHLQRAKKDLDDLQERMWNEYEMTYGSAKDLAAAGFAMTPGEAPDEKMQEAAAMSKTKRHQIISRIRSDIRDLGNVNVGAVEEYKALTERLGFLTTQHDDIIKSEEDLHEIIDRMTVRMEKQFKDGFNRVAESFNIVFSQMFGGGQAELKLTEGENELEAGIEINVQPPGKKLQSMMLLSGGERALTAIALLFAIQQLNPAAFCILDEIEAALDDANVERFAQYLREMSGNTQFIVITHRKGTMNAADTMYGVTMEEKGVSKCVSVRFE